MGIRIGTGVASGMPTRSPNGPPLTASVSTPNAAALASRFITTALSGTTTERNTVISSRNETSSTPPKNNGQPVRDPTGDVEVRGGHAPTSTVRSVPAVAAGTASSRSASTTSSVAASWGEVDQPEQGGVAALVDDGGADESHALDLSSCPPPRRRRPAGRRPMRPGREQPAAPKPGTEARRQAGRRPGGWCTTAGRSGRPEAQPDAQEGRREASSTASPPRAATHGRRWMKRLQRNQRDVSSACGSLFTNGTCRRSMLRPAKPRSAGRSVTEASMVSSTASDTVKAKPLRAPGPPAGCRAWRRAP